MNLLASRLIVTFINIISDQRSSKHFLSIKIQTVNMLGSVHHIVSVITAQLCHCGVEASRDNL